MLRNAEPIAVEDPGVDGVPELAQRLEEAGEHGAVIPGREIGDVLDEHGVGRSRSTTRMNDRHSERSRILADAAHRTRISSRIFACPARENGWHGHAAGDELDMVDAPAVEAAPAAPSGR